jgi:alanine dehydrogenase
LLTLNEAQVASLFTMQDAIDTVDRALHAQAEQRALFPLRGVVANADGLLASMPGTIASDPAALGSKLVSVFAGNAQRGEHTHQALIALFDPSNGRPAVLMDGRLITEMRTAAVSAVATRALAAEKAHTLAIIGTGVQALAHAHALALVAKLDEVRVWGHNRLHAETLVRQLREEGMHARAVDSSDEACCDADIVCTVTSSPIPVIESDCIAPGAHVNAVGACTPHAREIPPELMALASIFVDSIDGALREAGDIVLAMREGALPPAPRLTLLCDVVAGRTVGRTAPDEITLFESLGIAIEDLACAALVYERAVARGTGTQIDI